MTISARRVNKDVRRRCNNDETMGTIQPAGRNWRRRRHVIRLMGVGNDLGQGAGSGRESWGSSRNTTHRGVRVTVFFWENTMVVLSDAITLQKSMVHPPTKYVYRLNQGRGTRWWCQNWPGGGRWVGVISISKVLNLWALYWPWPTRRYVYFTYFTYLFLLTK